MTGPRASAFAEVLRIPGIKPDLWADPGNVLAFDNLLDAWGAARGGEARLRSHALADPAAFFAAVRKITGPLGQEQVDSINALLTEADHWPVGWMAYALATAWHESSLQPIRERGSNAYLSQYDTGRKAAALGNTPEADGDGIRFAGRGFVQLTGRANYAKAGNALGLDLIGNPDLALTPAVAVRILIWGMEGGKFTGIGLRDCIAERGTHDAFVKARRIINGTDRSQTIAGYAERFQDALEQGQWK